MNLHYQYIDKKSEYKFLEMSGLKNTISRLLRGNSHLGFVMLLIIIPVLTLIATGLIGQQLLYGIPLQIILITIALPLFLARLVFHFSKNPKTTSRSFDNEE